MARGGPRKADGASKKGSKATVTLLKQPEDGEIQIPPMPPAQDFIGLPEIQTNQRGSNDTQTMKDAGIDPYHKERDTSFDEEELVPEWNPAVVRWWNDIWSSPMASELVKSDIHGLYLGCYYLHESLNPFYKLTDRTNAAKAFENTLKNYGLTPSAREGLRWQVAQGTAAQKRTDQIRSSMSAGGKYEKKGSVEDMYKRHG